MCPYFKSKAGNLLDCLPLTGKATRIAFSSPQARELYQRKVCRANHSKCVVAQAHELNAKDT